MSRTGVGVVTLSDIADGLNGTGTKLQFSSDDVSWHDIPATGDRYLRSCSSVVGEPWVCGGSTVIEGTSGDRGTIHAYATGTSWSDASATAAIGGNPIRWDVVTISSDTTGFSQTKWWDSNSWEILAQVFDGSLLVNGSIKAVSLDVEDLFAQSATITNRLAVGTVKPEGTVFDDNIHRQYSIVLDGGLKDQTSGVTPPPITIYDNEAIPSERVLLGFDSQDRVFLRGGLAPDTISDMNSFSQSVRDILFPVSVGSSGGIVTTNPYALQTSTTVVSRDLVLAEANSLEALVSINFSDSQTVVLTEIEVAEDAPIYNVVIERSIGGGVFTTVKTFTVDGTVSSGHWEDTDPRSRFWRLDVSADLSYTDTSHGTVSGSLTYRVKINKTIASGWSNSPLVTALSLAQSSEGGAITGAATLLNGLPGSHYLDWDNFTDKPSTMAGYGITDSVGTYTGGVTTTRDVKSGVGSGGVALTINDGYGNANITFNHASGKPEITGNAGRIEVNKDSTTGAQMYFELKSGVTADTTVQTAPVLTLSETDSTFYTNVNLTSGHTYKIDGSEVYHFGNDNIGVGATNYSAGNHGHSYLPLAGGNLTAPLTIGGQIASSSAMLQVNGFMRTGNILVHEGGNTPNSNNKVISNTSGVLQWDGAGLYNANYNNIGVGATNYAQGNLVGYLGTNNTWEGANTFNNAITLNSNTYGDHLRLMRSSENWKLTPSTDGSLDLARDGGTGTAAVDITNANLTVSGTIKQAGALLSDTYAPKTDVFGGANNVKQHLSYSTSDGTISHNAMTIDYNLSGSTAFTGDKTHVGMLVDMDSTNTGGGLAEETRLYGVKGDVRQVGSGIADQVYGVFGYVRDDTTGGTQEVTDMRGVTGQSILSATSSKTIISSYGMYGYTATNSSQVGNVTNAYGVCGKALQNSTSGSVISNAYGGYFEVELGAGNITSAYAVRAIIDIDSKTVDGVIANSYLFRGEYQITEDAVIPANAYGIFISTNVENYFAGLIKTSNQFESTIATGTAPLIVASTTKVANLNTDYLGGYNHDKFGKLANAQTWAATQTLTSNLNLKSELDYTGASHFYIDNQATLSTSQTYFRNSAGGSFVNQLVLSRNDATFGVNVMLSGAHDIHMGDDSRMYFNYTECDQLRMNHNTSTSSAGIDFYNQSKSTHANIKAKDVHATGVIREENVLLSDIYIGLHALNYDESSTYALALKSIDQFKKWMTGDGSDTDYDLVTPSIATGFINAVIGQFNTVVAAKANIGYLSANAVSVGLNSKAINENPLFQNNQEVTATSGNSAMGWTTVSGNVTYGKVITDGQVADTCMEVTSSGNQTVMSDSFPIEDGKTYKVSVWARDIGAVTRDNYFYLLFQDGSKANLNTVTLPSGHPQWPQNSNPNKYWFKDKPFSGTWTKYEATFAITPEDEDLVSYTAADGAKYVRLGALLNHNGPVGTGTVQLQDYRFEEMTSSTTIVDGTITAKQINVADVFAQDITATGTITGAIVQTALPSDTTTDRTILDNDTLSHYRKDELLPSFQVGREDPALFTHVCTIGYQDDTTSDYYPGLGLQVLTDMNAHTNTFYNRGFGSSLHVKAGESTGLYVEKGPEGTLGHAAIFVSELPDYHAVDIRHSFGGSALRLTTNSEVPLDIVVGVLNLSTTPPMTTNSSAKVLNFNADLLDGYHVSTTRNAANSIPYRDNNGYFNVGWINTTSGATTTASTDYYVNTGDGYIRKKTLANVKTEIVTSAAVLAVASMNVAVVKGRVVSDCNGAEYRVPGMYGFNGAPANGTGESYSAMIVAANSDTGLQIAGGHTNDELYFRGWYGNGVYQPWRKVLHSNNWTGYVTKSYIDSLNVDAGTLDSISSASFMRSDVTDYQNNHIWQRGYIVNESAYRNRGVYGTYVPELINHIWSMGTGYKVAQDGSDFGNLYGIAYYHPNNDNANGNSYGSMAGGHQMVWCSNGVPKAAMGNGFWTSGNVTAQAGFIGNLTGNVTGNASTVTNGVYTTSFATQATYAGIVGKYLGKVSSSGVLEVARYIDFHTTNSTHDGDMRLDCSSADQLLVTGGVFRVDSEIRATGDVVAYYSDERLKTVTEYLDPEEALRNVCGWKKVRYVANQLANKLGGYDTSKQEIGLLAGEIHESYPELTPLAPFDTSDNIEGEESTSVSGEDYRTLNYERVTAIQAAAIEALNNKLEEQARKIELLMKHLEGTISE